MSDDDELLDGATEEGHPAAWPANAGEFAARWNSWPSERREEWLSTRIETAERAMYCWSALHEGRIGELTERVQDLMVENESLRAERRECPHPLSRVKFDGGNLAVVCNACQIVVTHLNTLPVLIGDVDVER